MKSLSIAVVGGDLRYVRLCNILCLEGFNTYVYGITHPDIPTEVKICSELEEIEECQYVVAPVPFSKDSKSVYTPLSNVSISIERFMEVCAGKHIVMGALKDKIKELFDKHDLKYTDLMKMDKVAILNAVPTAEGAIQYAMQNSEITLHDSKCLVLGFGRCGKVLANKLKGIGAKVYVEARSTTDLAYIEAYDYTPIDLKELKESLKGFDFIFNTVPVVIMDIHAINCMMPHTIYLELASSPGGIDIEYCKKAGITHIPAPSLPGKVAPTTAAQIIYQGLLLILRHEGATV